MNSATWKQFEVMIPVAEPIDPELKDEVAEAIRKQWRREINRTLLRVEMDAEYRRLGRFSTNAEAYEMLVRYEFIDVEL